MTSLKPSGQDPVKAEAVMDYPKLAFEGLLQPPEVGEDLRQSFQRLSLNFGSPSVDKEISAPPNSPAKSNPFFGSENQPSSEIEVSKSPTK
ncbi:hypothetical protein L596_007471 [Steinernema carpocapsae]|uniref:Uncharacterized protein n=1 Tax=Steinernema carpocapsae TaxID=34508 RepID=A0A4V6A605_STECR|nr:hypothetical protein L596_007471 [Steinernema carpocapsae]